MEYTLKRSARARSMRISVYPGGDVVVVAPHHFTARSVERFAQRYAGWAQRHRERMKKRTVIRIARADISKLKQRALALASARCEYFAKLYSVRFRKISIRAQKTRWGSCSHVGNLTFNYRIAALPPQLADYIIVHELCHLLEMNHSERFWKLVALTVPEYRAARKELRNVSFVFDSAVDKSLAAPQMAL